MEPEGSLSCSQQAAKFESLWKISQRAAFHGEDLLAPAQISS
jgi:hypothetical protein